jgi:hypothetical protein
MQHVRACVTLWLALVVATGCHPPQQMCTLSFLCQPGHLLHVYQSVMKPVRNCHAYISQLRDFNLADIAVCMLVLMQAGLTN